MYVLTHCIVETLKSALTNSEDPDETRGGSRISGKGVHMFKGVGVHFADLISFYFS